ncbi:MAG: hypothetical protein O3A53_08385 [Acidobacteria bacterium]|nr:hypothetical protein [Acidobacteriota bacterium]MDA1234804.1 hypothetical protein [Acidobacteriota bacterium]
MDYRFANAADIPALAAFAGDYYAGDPDMIRESREKLCWTRLGDDRRIVIFEDEDVLAATIVYKPSSGGFDLEEFIVNGGGLIAAEAFRLLLDELLAPTAKVFVAQPLDTVEAMQFWRTQGFEADRVTLAQRDASRRAAANES